MDKLTAFQNAYFTAIRFTLDPEDEGASLSPDAIERGNADCAAFLEKAEKFIVACLPGVFTNSWEQAGYDFWMTRTKQGCGFWDGDWPEPQDDQLTKLAHEFEELEVYSGDDGLLYFI